MELRNWWRWIGGSRRDDNGGGDGRVVLVSDGSGVAMAQLWGGGDTATVGNFTLF